MKIHTCLTCSHEHGLHKMQTSNGSTSDQSIIRAQLDPTSRWGTQDDDNTHGLHSESSTRPKQIIDLGWTIPVYHLKLNLNKKTFISFS
jgi:hypothetical protein